MKNIGSVILAIGMMSIGLIGIYYNIDYSGWAIFIAVLAAFNT